MSAPARFGLAFGAQARDHRTMRAGALVVIEDVNDTGTHWYLSFDGPNPADDQCVRCVDRAEAFKLMSLIETMSIVPNLGMSSISAAM